MARVVAQRFGFTSSAVDSKTHLHYRAISGEPPHSRAAKPLYARSAWLGVDNEHIKPLV
jgi:hypothetical protein